MAGNILAKISEFVNQYQHDLMVGLALFLVAWSFFHIGTMYAVVKEPIAISRSDAPGIKVAERPSAKPLDARVVVSKGSSSKKYHYSWCGSGNRIKEENRMWFETVALAEAAGYSLAGNCK